MINVNEIIQQTRAEVLAACAVEVCRFCWRHTNGSEKEYDLPTLATAGVHKGHWVHKKILGYVNPKGDRCEADHIRLLQPAAKDLEELLREAGLKGKIKALYVVNNALAKSKDLPINSIGLVGKIIVAFEKSIKTELEKARASEEKP